jgi:hypothetical protein
MQGSPAATTQLRAMLFWTPERPLLTEMNLAMDKCFEADRTMDANGGIEGCRLNDQPCHRREFPSCLFTDRCLPWWSFKVARQPLRVAALPLAPPLSGVTYTKGDKSSEAGPGDKPSVAGNYFVD